MFYAIGGTKHKQKIGNAYSKIIKNIITARVAH